MSSQADLAALLRLRQLRERREAIALEQTRKRHTEASASENRADRAVSSFAVLERIRREQARATLATPSLAAGQLLGTVAGLADIRSAGITVAAVAAEARADVVEAAGAVADAGRRHDAAMRKTEAFEALLSDVRAEAGITAERAAEIESEDIPRGRPRS